MGGRGEPELSSPGHVPLLLHQVQTEGPAVAATGLQGGPPTDGVGEARDSLETLVGRGHQEVHRVEIQRDGSEAGHGVHEVESPGLGLSHQQAQALHVVHHARAGLTVDHTHRTELDTGLELGLHLGQVHGEDLSESHHLALNPSHLADLSHSLAVGSISQDQYPGSLSRRTGLKDGLHGIGSAPLQQDCGPLLGRHPGNVQQTCLDVSNSLEKVLEWLEGDSTQHLYKLFVSGAQVSQHGLLDSVSAAQGPGGEELLICQLSISKISGNKKY